MSCRFFTLNHYRTFKTKYTMLPGGSNQSKIAYLDTRIFFSQANSAKSLLRTLQTQVMLKSVMEIGGFLALVWHSLIEKSLFYTVKPVLLYMNGKVLILVIIFFLCFLEFYALNRVHNFANIMYRLCAIQLGECHKVWNLRYKRMEQLELFR